MQPVLKVDLTTQEISQFDIPQDWQREFLGGASLAARMLYDELTAALDPLSLEAPILFLNGPLSGTSGPTMGRFVVCAKSPATGLWGESNCGGFWGPELRKAGFDGVWITGKAESPVYLSIYDQTVEIQSADHLWGLDTFEIQDAVQDELGNGKVHVAGIGVAGENQMPLALILTDHGRVAGRTGMGAVMGSKNLKAVAVKGTGSVPVVDTEKYKQIRSETNRALRKDTVANAIRELGSAASTEYFDYLGMLPKKYYSEGVMEGVENISGATVAETILEGYSACHACVIACGRVVKLDGKKEKQKGAEYETMVGFGPNLWISDLAFITRMNDLCDRYGMDTISVSNTLGLVFSLYGDGIITEEDTGGLKLVWGDQVSVEALVHQIGKNEGFGKLLAQGARAVARHFNVEDRAVQVNGLELAYHDPRGASGMALVYATSPRGGCHNQGDYYLVDIGNAEDEIGMKIYNRQAGAEKAMNVAIHQNWRTVSNAAVICIFGNVMPVEYVALINAGCGFDWTVEEMLKTGERGWNLKRAINNRMGLTRENDSIPKPFLEPYQEGGAAGFVPDFEGMLRAYYEARDWDWETGFPTREKLKSLGLDWVEKDLWPTT